MVLFKSDVKVALVDPAFPPSCGMPVSHAYEPYGLLSLSAALKRQGIDTRVFHVSPDTAENDVSRIMSWGPGALGVSVHTANNVFARKFAGLVKERGFTGPVVFGGVHTMVAPEIALDQGVDWVLLGEGEITGALLFDTLLRGGDPESIPGVVFARNGRLVKNKPPELIEDLDSIPWCDRNQMSPELEFSVGAYALPKAVVMTSRGCKSTCSFCLAPLLSRRRVRFRDPNDVAKECLDLRDRHGIRFIFFADDEFFADSQHVLAICEALVRRRVNLPFFCMGKIDLLDNPILEHLASAGCHRIYFGVERTAGPSRWTFKARRALSVREKLELTRSHGIFSQVGCIIGFPDENDETLSTLKAYVCDLPADYLSVNLLSPFPGTALHATMKSSGIRFHEDDSEYGFDKLAFEHPALTERQLIEWRQRILRSFYLSRRRFLQVGYRLVQRPALVTDYGRMALKAFREGLFRH